MAKLLLPKHLLLEVSIDLPSQWENGNFNIYKLYIFILKLEEQML